MLGLNFICLFVCIPLGVYCTPYNGTHPNDLLSEYDFIIVGAGSAGCRIAGKLSAISSWKILLLEAGGSQPDFTEIPLLTSLGYNIPQADWGFRTEPMENAMLSAPGQVRTIAQGKMLGGGSSLNYMAYQRGNRDDYDRWEKEFGAKGWGYDDVLKVFMKDENNNDESLSDEFHGRSGALGVSVMKDNKNTVQQAFFEAAMETGLEWSDVNDGEHWGVHHMHATIHKGRRASSYNAFVRPHLNRKNLHISIHSEAIKVLFEGKHAAGITFVKDGVEHRIKASKEVIISAGAFKSPQLLMLSGIGDKKHLQKFNIPVIKDLPGVGQNLQDHFGFLGINAHVPASAVTNMRDVDALHQWLVDNTGPFGTPSGLHLGVAYISEDESRKSPDIEILFLSTKYLKIYVDLHEEVFASFYGPYLDEDVIMGLPIIQRPKSRGSVKLASSDPLAYPSIQPDYFGHPDDIKTIIKAGRYMVDLLQSEPMRAANVSISQLPFPPCASHALFSDDYIVCVATHHTLNVYHPCGTCRMAGDARKDAVVDARLRVYGVEGLRVADASIMPLIPVGHLNAPSIMIGAKAGDMILEDYGQFHGQKDEL